MNYASTKVALLGAAFAFLATGCATIASDSRQTVIHQAEKVGFVRQRIAAGTFDLTAFVRQSSSLSDMSDRSEPSERARPVVHDFEAHSGSMQREIGQKWAALPAGAVDRSQVRQAARARRDDFQAPGVDSILNVYIEGDGAPWLSPRHPPHDPTPLRPIALTLAMNDPSPAVAYIGRPCQYLDSDALTRCDVAWWSNRRFDRDVVKAFDEALTQLKAVTGAQRLHLIGYSGGGVIAALLSFRRKDIDRLVTVAAPLALAEWTAWHGVTPFSDASDPIHQPGQMPPAIHWVGGRDVIVPPAIVEAFIRMKGGRMMCVPDYNHECCWAGAWPSLLEEMK